MLDKFPRLLLKSLKFLIPKSSYEKIKTNYNKSIVLPYNIVSLGTNCYPKTILTRHKLKKLKSEGEKTLPFDLAGFHHTSFISEFIKNDFSDFFSDMRYIEDINCWDNFRKINFSHEKSFGPQDCDLLIEKYKKRINNFNQIIQDETPILFVQILTTKSSGEDINNLHHILKEKRANNPFQLLVIDTINITKDVNPQIEVMKIDLPVEDSELYKPIFYKSKTGKKFEKNIINKCKKILKEKLKAKLKLYL